MCRIIFAFAFFSTLALARAAEPTKPFSATLSLEQKQRLGLSHLSAAQLAELDAAIGAYTRGETTVAVQQAVQQVERKTEEKVQQVEKKAAVAAEAAVADYKKKQEPGVVARTLDVLKRKQHEEQRERFTGRIVGVFRGWHGGTYFPLDNGQVWRQVGAETNALSPVQDVEVEIYKSGNGYWRLKYGGAWVTVKRLQ